MATRNITKANVFLRPPMAVIVRDSTEYDVDTIAHQSGNTIRLTFNGSPDLSNLSTDDTIKVKSASNDSNKGTFPITAVNDTSDYIEITNEDRSDATDDEASDSPAVAYDAEVLNIYVADGDTLSVTPEFKTIDNDMSDAQELADIVAAKAVIEYTFEEFEQADIDAVNSRGDVFEVETSKGGANGTGKLFNMTGLDHIRAMPSGEYGTMIQAKKVAPGGAIAMVLSNLYTLSDNAA